MMGVILVVSYAQRLPPWTFHTRDKKALLIRKISYDKGLLIVMIDCSMGLSLDLEDTRLDTQHRIMELLID